MNNVCFKLSLGTSIIRITFLSQEAGTAFFCDDSDEVSAKLLGAVIIINIVY